jgi:flavin reductase (DIM6/NTAB) family NADH-FMN oxidoreductase RutF
LIETHEAGDHTILIAEVQHAFIAQEDKPLLFFRGKYGRMAEMAS